MNRFAKFIISLAASFFISAFIMSYAADYIESIVLHRIISFTLLGVFGIVLWKLLGRLPKWETKSFSGINVEQTQPTKNSDSVQFMFTEEMSTIYAITDSIQKHLKVDDNELIPEKSIVIGDKEVSLMTMMISCRRADSEVIKMFVREQLDQVSPGKGIRVRFSDV